jgi:hypothetical protein
MKPLTQRKVAPTFATAFPITINELVTLKVFRSVKFTFYVNIRGSSDGWSCLKGLKKFVVAKGVFLLCVYSAMASLFLIENDLEITFVIAGCQKMRFGPRK